VTHNFIPVFNCESVLIIPYIFFLEAVWPLNYEGVSKGFRTDLITKYTLTTINTHWEATQSVMTTKLTILTQKIAIKLHLVAESCLQFSLQTFGYTLVYCSFWKDLEKLQHHMIQVWYRVPSCRPNIKLKHFVWSVLIVIKINFT
jgi:hypothetical protein